MKTVSLELSKQLKEAKYPSEDVRFHWVVVDGEYELLTLQEFQAKTFRNSVMAEYASPSADEILDQLPIKIKFKNFGFLHIDYTHDGMYIHYGDEVHFTSKEDESLVDLLARMWLYLKKEGLLASQNH